MFAQSWEHLLFAHWALPRRQIETLLPERLQLDTFDGKAWLGVTPFKLVGLRAHGRPRCPCSRRLSS
jgi:uncharacterized protein YqjF (DUF2071 family)